RFGHLPRLAAVAWYARPFPNQVYVTENFASVGIEIILVERLRIVEVHLTQSEKDILQLFHVDVRPIGVPYGAGMNKLSDCISRLAVVFTHQVGAAHPKFK